MKNDFQQVIIRIRPTKGWSTVDLPELLRYKDLLYFLIIRGFKAKYAQSILGIGWAIIQPLFSTLIFTIVFGRIAKVSSDGVPYVLFSLVALVPWLFFANSLSDSSSSLVTNSSMVSKVYFPRIVLPLSSGLSRILDFLVGLVLIFVFLIFYKVQFTFTMLLLPFLVVLLVVTSLSFGIVFSALAVQYRDVKYGLGFGVQLLMYVSPVVYPTSSIPERFQNWYALNPMVGVIEGFRSALLGTQEFPVLWLGMSSLVSFIVLLFGVFYFKRMEKIFADVI